MSLSRCHFAPSSKAQWTRTLRQTMPRIMISHQNIPSPQLVTTRMGGLSPAGPPVNISGLQSQTGPLLELSPHFNTHLLTLTVTWSLSWALKIQTGARNEMTALEVWERQTQTRGCQLVARIKYGSQMCFVGFIHAFGPTFFKLSKFVF